MQSSNAMDNALERLGCTKKREMALVISLSVLLVVIAVLSFTVGVYALTPSELVSALTAWATNSVTPELEQTINVLIKIRGPRLVLAAAVGAALAVSGAAYQGIFRNPMVSPDILGVSNGASVGVALGLLLELPSLAVHTMSFAFGMLAVLLVLAVAHGTGGRTGNVMTVMILAGVVVGSIASAFLSLIKYVADPENTLPAITYWLMGSFARSGNMQNIVVMLVVLLLGGGLLMVLRWKLNAMTFGEAEARSLGVDVGKTRIVVILAATLMTSISVCFCGAIGWVGLIIPHIVRLMVGPNYRALIPVSMLAGANFMLIVDNVARIAIPGELPVGVITALIGAPLFIFMLYKGRGQYL